MPLSLLPSSLPPPLEHHLRSSPWERRVLFPLSFLLLLLLTLAALLLVATNCLHLTFDPTSTPGGHSVQVYLLGRESTSTLGALGALLEVITILYPFCLIEIIISLYGIEVLLNPDLSPSYFMCASVVGFYSTPVLTHLLPASRDTPMTKVR